MVPGSLYAALGPDGDFSTAAQFLTPITQHRASSPMQKHTTKAQRRQAAMLYLESQWKTSFRISSPQHGLQGTLRQDPEAIYGIKLSTLGPAAQSPTRARPNVTHARAPSPKTMLRQTQRSKGAAVEGKQRQRRGKRMEGELARLSLAYRGHPQVAPTAPQSVVPGEEAPARRQRRKVKAEKTAAVEVQAKADAPEAEAAP